MYLKGAVIAALFSCAPMLMAQLSGPEYPPPGGVTFGSSGGSGTVGGKTFSYSGFDPSQYGLLYFGPVDVANVSNSGDMTFTGVSGGTYEFDSTAPWTFNFANGSSPQLATRMLLTVSGLGAEDTQGSLGAATPNSGYPLFLVTGNFSINFVFESLFDGVWTPVNDFQNANNNNGPQNQTSVQFDFFNTSAAPEPSSLLLVGMGFALVGLVRFRRKSIRLGGQ